MLIWKLNKEAEALPNLELLKILRDNVYNEICVSVRNAAFVYSNGIMTKEEYERAYKRIQEDRGLLGNWYDYEIWMHVFHTSHYGRLFVFSKEWDTNILVPNSKVVHLPSMVLDALEKINKQNLELPVFSPLADVNFSTKSKGYGSLSVMGDSTIDELITRAQVLKDIVENKVLSTNFNVFSKEYIPTFEEICAYQDKYCTYGRD